MTVEEQANFDKLQRELASVTTQLQYAIHENMKLKSNLKDTEETLTELREKYFRIDYAIGPYREEVRITFILAVGYFFSLPSNERNKLFFEAMTSKVKQLFQSLSPS